jgi:hypothetical protein
VSVRHYIGFDPGKSTGVAEFSGEPPVVVRLETLRGEKALDEYLDELETRELDDLTIIYEAYKAGFSAQGLASEKMIKIHGGKSNQTEQAIGSILRTARRLKAKVVAQDSNILPMAIKHSGVKLGTNHNNSHDKAAYNHVHEYLLRQGLIQPRVIDARRK